MKAVPVKTGLQANFGSEFAQPSAEKRLRVSSHDLFGNSREVVINHAGDEYRLRITSQGKLILTK